MPLQVNDFEQPIGTPLLVQSDKDKSVLLAFSFGTPQNTTQRIVTFDDGNYVRAIEVFSVLIDNPIKFECVDIKGTKYTFQPLTLDLYNQYVKDKLWNGPDFGTYEEMAKYLSDPTEIYPGE